MRRTLSFLFAIFVASSLLAADRDSEHPHVEVQLLRLARDRDRVLEVRRGAEGVRTAARYTDALATLDNLETESLKDGYEKDRAALAPVLAFYRGACLASLDRPAEAQMHFEAFLVFQPNASLDPAVYSKKVITALDNARRSQSAAKQTPEQLGSLALSYRAFPKPRHEEQVSLGEEWANGPARFLMSPDERNAFTRLADPVSRSEYVTAFWKKRDPKPETPDNEFRDEFEKRVAFADSRFSQGETAGSLTDRGMVFILLGPPTYIGRKPLTTGDDANDPNMLKRYRAADERTAAVPGGGRSAQVARVDAVTGPGSRVNEAASNWQEVWHYRREHLPKDVPYLQVDFQFVTKKGYGKNVLQREAQILDTLERAKKRLRDAKA